MQSKFDVIFLLWSSFFFKNSTFVKKVMIDYSRTSRFLGKAICAFMLSSVALFSHADEGGIPIEYTYQVKSHSLCHISYHVTTEERIEIKRTTMSKKGQGGVVDYVLIRPLREEDANSLYLLVSHSSDFLGRFLPRIVEDLGKSEKSTKNKIFSLIQSKKRREFGIFYKN